MGAAADTAARLRAQADALEEVEAAQERLIAAKAGEDEDERRAAKDDLRAKRASYREHYSTPAGPNDAVVVMASPANNRRQEG